jgi:hypothetical protein
MPRTSLPVTPLPGNTGIVSMTNAGTGMTAVDNTNGHTIAIPTTTIPATANVDNLIIVVLNTNGTGQTMTIRCSTQDGGATKLGAGTQGYPFTPGFRGGLGDITFSAMTLTTGLGIYGPFDPSRFIQPDNTISIDFSGATGFVAAFLLARAF